MSKKPKILKSKAAYIDFSSKAIKKADEVGALVSFGMAHDDWCPMHEGEPCCCKCERQVVQLKADGSKVYLALWQNGPSYDPINDSEWLAEAHGKTTAVFEMPGFLS